ncbi:unnamed protein product [Lupinus luteus]|uniref:Uncharacterized protein n=1 Tax=Lupinus luteus TaxID=3873 RepID=A0AAV1WZE9_LUPLU
MDLVKRRQCLCESMKELDIKYYSIGLPYRDETDDKVIVESVEATIKYFIRAFVKASMTIAYEKNWPLSLSKKKKYNSQEICWKFLGDNLSQSWTNKPPNGMGTNPCGNRWDGIRCTSSKICQLLVLP